MNLEKFFSNFWDNTIKLIGTLSLITLLVLIFMSFFADHKIRSYYLSQGSDRITIHKDIDWQGDESIILDKTVTYDQALIMLDRLNKTVK